MKTLYTIYTSFAKRLAIILTLLTLGVTTAWAAVYTYDCTSNKNFYTDAGLTTNPSTGNSNTFAENASFYAEDGACFTVLRESKVYFNSGYLMVGNYQPVLQLPTYANEKITKVKFWNSSGCSTSVKVAIKSGSNTAAAQQTWSTKGSSYTYNISETYQSSTLKLDVTSANAQITKIEITTSASCANSIAVSAGTKTNVNSISFSPNSIATCSSTATDRQVTITVTPNTGYEMTSGSRLTFTKTSGTATATYVSGPTTNGSSYQFVYRFDRDDNGVGTFSASCTAKKTTVSFDQNGGEGGQTAPVTATYDQPMPTPITLPTRYGHTFGGYYDGAGGTGTQYYTAEGASARTWNKTSANITLYAQWTEKDLTNYRTSCGSAATLVSIAVSGQTTTYNVGDSFSFDGTCAATYDDESTKTVTPTSVSSPDMSTAGKKTVTVTYTEGDVTVTTEYDITVNVVKTATSLTWSADSYTATIASPSNLFPTLKVNPEAIKGSVTYSSSHPEYATIDANGNIILKSAGETTITASYAGDEDYAAAEDTYTLTVEKSDNCRWEEVTINDIEYGDEVVIIMVDNKNSISYAMDNSKATSQNPLAIEINTDIFSSGDVPNTIIWDIQKDANGIVFYSNSVPDYSLYCTLTGVRVGVSTGNTFTISNGYIQSLSYLTYLAVATGANIKDWRQYDYESGNITNQTLKFYKKTCLPANEYWVNYNLSNITCTTDPIPSQIANDGEDLLLEFSANDGYKLPETISVKMGETEIGNNENYCVWYKETGALLIAAERITDNITITIEGCERLATPTNLSVTNITSTSARLSWNAVTNADEYRVCIMDGETQLEELTTTETYVNVMNLKKNSFYTWDVVAEANDYCESLATAWIEFRTPDVYTVTFNTDGGTPIDPQAIDHGSKATKPANPTKTGYTFAGWYTEADAEFDFNTPIESATTLYAKWNANQYTITFSKQWGDGGTANATVTFNSNNFSVATIDLPTRGADYKFGGYYTETGGAGLQIVDAEGIWQKNKDGYLDANGNWIKAESVTLYAKWTKIHTITWVVNNNTETPHHTSTALDGSTIDALPTPPADDLFEDCEVNAFVGWSTDNIGLEPDATAPTDLFKTLSEAQSKIGAINGDKKFYAVYANASNGADSYKLATTLEDLFDGQTVIIAKDNGALEKDNNTIDKVNISPDGNGNLSNVTDNIKWTLEASDTHWKLKNNGGYLGVTSTANQTAVSVTETNNVWQIAKSAATGDYFYICQQNTTIGLQYFNNQWQIYSNNSIASSTNFTLKIYVPNVSNYITRCTALPDPVWGGATIDKTEISVNCGETSSANGAAQISFPKATNYNLYKDITVEVTSGNFIIASSRDGEYTTSVTLTPTQSGTNVGTLDGKYVYVRAVAPPMSSDQLTGTITISGKQIATQVINVTATVTCDEYTLTFNDCGDTQKITDFAGTSVEEMEPWAEICSEPVQYVFDGWATEPVTNGVEGYEKVDFSTFTMPNNNTTILYAVYRYAEEGGEPVNGFVKVTEALSNWSGDYVIVNETAKKAIGNAYNNNNNNTLTAIDVTIENDKVVSPSESIIWQISKNGEYYTMYNATAEKYAYITQDKSEAAGLDNNPKNLRISFNNSIAKIYGETITRCFSYYSTNTEWRVYSIQTYSTGALYRLSNKTIRYTSSLVCGSIEAENAIVTSTVGQIVKVNVPITLGYSDASSITGTSDNEAFTVVTKNDVAVGESIIEVHYKPTAYVNTANQEETATITLTTSNGATTTFNVTGRCLPETFAIVAKVGNVWYALPSQGLNSTTPPIAYPVEVDNMADPTAVVSVPANANWSLRQVYASSGSNDRFADNGENLVFVNNASPAMALNASQTGNYLLADAQYNNYYSTYPGLYEWTPTTTDLETYTLTNAQRTDRTLNVATNTVFGVHSDNKATTEVRFLPITGRYTPAALQVVEWKENSVVIMYNGNPAQTASVSVNGAAAQNTTLSAAQRDIAVYELAANGLAANPTQRLSITIGSEKTILSIPYIINSETTDAAILPDGTVAARQEVAKVSDLVILKDATLTAAGAKGNPYKFRNVTVYGGGKLVVPAENGFGVNSLTLRIGGVTADGNYDYVYPEFVLNTNTKDAYTNTSGKINLDYVTTKEQYYTFVAPFAVSTKDIKYPVDIYGNNVAANNTGSFEFQYYDGAARAAGERGWTVVDEDPTEGATLIAHKGYTFYGMPKKVTVNGETTRQKFGIHRIPMTETAAKVMSHENSEQTVTISAYPSQHNINAGWNLIGNPYMSTISRLDNTSIQIGTIVLVDDRWQWSDQGTQENRFIVFPSNDGEWYYTSQASNATLPAFKNFFVQIATEEATTLAIPRNTAMAQLLAPARRTAEEIEHDIEMAIVLEKDDAFSDQLDFLINDTYGAGFDYNADFTKMMNNTQLNLYGVLMEDNLSFVALDHYSARGSVAIGYQVPAAGEYTLRISDKPYVMLNKIEALYVTDHEMNPAVTTNLMEEDYVFHVGKAEINDTRFTISLTVETNTNGDDITTDMGELDIHSKQPQKFFYDSKLYILRDGKIYSATGHEIKTINE